LEKRVREIEKSLNVQSPCPPSPRGILKTLIFRVLILTKLILKPELNNLANLRDFRESLVFILSTIYSVLSTI
jgi:hypothetical protein